VAGRHAARLRWSEAGARTGAGTAWRSSAEAGQASFWLWAEAEARYFFFLFYFYFPKSQNTTKTSF
jgi:hypothetical protein